MQLFPHLYTASKMRNVIMHDIVVVAIFVKIVVHWHLKLRESEL